MKLLLKKIPVEHRYSWKRKDGSIGRGVKKFRFKKILVEEITKKNIIRNLPEKVRDKPWIKKLKIRNMIDYVIWSYPGKPDIYIYENGFYVRRNFDNLRDEPSDDEIHAVYRCASILSKAGLIRGFTLDEF